MKQLFGYVFVIAILFLITSCDQQSAIQPSGKKIKIGVIAPFSGKQLAKGSEGLLGIKIAMQLQPYINNGDAVELVIEDDKGKPEQTVKALVKLVEMDQVSAILLLSDSNPALAIAQIADQYETPILSLIATHPHITKGNKFVSQMVFDSAFQGTVAALYIRDELLIDRVAVFTNPESANSIYLSSEFNHKFESVNGVVTDSILLFDENDYTAILKSIRGNEPELLYFPIETEKVLGFVKAAKEMNWTPIMMGSDGLVANVRSRHKEEMSLFEGMLTIDFFSQDMPLTEYGEKIKSAFAAQFSVKASSYNALGAEGYALLIDVMNRCDQPIDRLCVNEQLRSTENFIGVMGKIAINEKGKVLRPLIVNVIHEGRANFVVKVY